MNWAWLLGMPYLGEYADRACAGRSCASTRFSTALATSFSSCPASAAAVARSRREASRVA
jgi:hypothetical protein